MKIDFQIFDRLMLMTVDVTILYKIVPRTNIHANDIATRPCF